MVKRYFWLMSHLQYLHPKGTQKKFQKLKIVEKNFKKCSSSTHVHYNWIFLPCTESSNKVSFRTKKRFRKKYFLHDEKQNSKFWSFLTRIFQKISPFLGVWLVCVYLLTVDHVVWDIVLKILKHWIYKSWLVKTKIFHPVSFSRYGLDPFGRKRPINGTVWRMSLIWTPCIVFFGREFEENNQFYFCEFC